MKQNFSRLFNAIDDFLFVIDGHGKVIDINESVSVGLGYEKRELTGKDISHICASEFHQKSISILNHILSGESSSHKSPVNNEYMVLQAKDGSAVYCLCTINPLETDPEPLFLVSAVNVSILKETENKLSKNLIQQSLLADISQNFISLNNFNEKIKYTLQGVGNHTGVSRVYIFEDTEDGTATSNTYEWCNNNIDAQIDELQGVPYEIIPSWKKILTEKGRVFSTNIQELPEDILAILEPQGIKSILVLPLYVENKFFGFIGFDECERQKLWQTDELELLRTIAGIISNSFERKIFQKKLAESEIRLKLAIDTTGTCLWDWNIVSGDLYFNDIWHTMLGYDMNNIEANITGWEVLIHPDDKNRVLEELNAHVEGKTESYVSIYRVKAKSGDWKWVIDKGKVVEHDAQQNATRAIGTIIDFDKEKRAEEELRNLNITKDKLFSILAHDLRGPIGTIMQISEMVSDKGVLNEETQYQFLNAQKELSQNTFQLLDNLLNWARFNLEQIRYNPKTIFLNEVINDSILGVKYKATQKGVGVNIEYKKDFYVWADEEMVKIIIRNLLNNAIKFTDSGTINIILKEHENHIQIKIIDTGVGISKEDLDKILSDNEYHTTKGTSNEAGSGLGLKLCKSLITENKGLLHIESAPGVGSSFIFTLPLAER